MIMVHYVMVHVNPKVEIERNRVGSSRISIGSRFKSAKPIESRSELTRMLSRHDGMAVHVDDRTRIVENRLAQISRRPVRACAGSVGTPIRLHESSASSIPVT